MIYNLFFFKKEGIFKMIENINIPGIILFLIIMFLILENDDTNEGSHYHRPHPKPPSCHNYSQLPPPNVFDV